VVCDLSELDYRLARGIADEVKARNMREDERTARICATVANALCKKKDGKPFTVSDFMPETIDTSDPRGEKRFITWLKIKAARNRHG